MNSLAEKLAKASAMANIDAKKTSIEQLRKDFKTVFDAYRAHGCISDSERANQVREAGAAVSEHSGDSEWMDCASKHFRQMAHQIEIDRARALDIAEEVRAMKKEAA